MKFNPIFFPANSSADFVSRNEIKAFHDAKYLFSDLVKVSAKEETSKDLSKYSDGNEVGTSELSAGSNLEFNYDYPDEELLSRELTGDSSPSLITVISSLVESTEKNSTGNAKGDFLDEQTACKNVEIYNVDKKALKDFIQQVESRGNKLINIKQSKTDNLIGSILLNDDLTGMENLKQTYPGSELIFEELNKNSKIDLEVNSAAELQDKKINSVENVSLQNIRQNNQKITSLNNVMKFGISNSIDDLFHTLEQTSTNDLPKGVNTKQGTIINSINKISIAAINSQNNSAESPAVPKNSIIPQNKYNVQVELSPLSSENINERAANNSFLPGNNIKNLLRQNDNLNHLRTKIANIFIDVEQLNVTKDQPGAGRTQFVRSKEEKETVSVKLDKSAGNSPASTEGKTASEIRKDVIDLKNDKDPDSRKNEQQNTGKNIAEIKPDDNLQTKNGLNNSQTKLFTEQELIQNGRQLIDDVKEIVKSKLEADTPKLKLANKSDVINNILKSIQNKENKSIEIKLNPPELGKLKVTLDYAEKKISLRMNVENETARQLINNSINDLKKELILAGIQLEDVQVSVTGNEQEGNYSDRSNRRSSANETLNKNETHNAVSAKMMGYNTYDYII